MASVMVAVMKTQLLAAACAAAPLACAQAQTSWIYECGTGVSTFTNANSASTNLLAELPSGGGTERLRVGTNRGGFTVVIPRAGVEAFHRLVPRLGVGPARQEIRGTGPSPRERARAGGLAVRPRLLRSAGTWDVYALLPAFVLPARGCRQHSPRTQARRRRCRWPGGEVARGVKGEKTQPRGCVPRCGLLRLRGYPDTPRRFVRSKRAAPSRCPVRNAPEPREAIP